MRELLDVEPRGDFQARVMRRISDQGASGFDRNDRLSRTLLWLGAPIAAAAMIALAVLLPQRGAQAPAPVARIETPRTPPAPAPSPAPVPLVSASPRQTPPVPPVVVASRRATVASAPDRLVSAASVEPADDTTGIEPLNSITPIQMAPLAEHRVATSDISVRPLNPITELQIVPLSPPERRN